MKRMQHHDDSLGCRQDIMSGYHTAGFLVLCLAAGCAWGETTDKPGGVSVLTTVVRAAMSRNLFDDAVEAVSVKVASSGDRVTVAAFRVPPTHKVPTELVGATIRVRGVFATARRQRRRRSSAVSFISDRYGKVACLYGSIGLSRAAGG